MQKTRCVPPTFFLALCSALVSACSLGEIGPNDDPLFNTGGSSGGGSSTGGSSGFSGSGGWPSGSEGGGNSASGGTSPAGGSGGSGGAGAPSGGASSGGSPSGGAPSGGAPSGGSPSTGGSESGGSGGIALGGAGGVPTGGGPCEFPQGVPEADFIAHASSYQDTDPSVDADVNAVMMSLSGCSAGSDCPIVGFPGTTTDEICQSWFAAVTQQLRSMGYCAGQHQVGGTDEIAVSNTGCSGQWYGYHICYYGGPKVVWNPGARRGWWMINPSYCGQ